MATPRSSSLLSTATANNNTNNNNAAAADDDDSALSLSEQTNRPLDIALNQQRVNAWHPILDPVWVIVGLFYLGVILVPVGWKIDQIQKNVVEEKVTYDSYVEDYNINDTECGIGDNFTAGRICNLTFTMPRDMNPPILIHYELTNFHQNHRSYYLSKDPYQLLGSVGEQDELSERNCQPLNKLGNTTINPCGLIANTLFNDVFELVEGNDRFSQKLQMIETGIAWQSDIQYVYRQPDGFKFSECSLGLLNETTCDPQCCPPEEESCIQEGTVYYDEKREKCYRYFYPNDDTTQYLHETYPNIISPIEGVTNEHFIVWMRIATQPSFRKLYGWIDQPIAANETLVFQTTSNYVVTRFQGSKALIVSTTSIFGGKNPYLAPVFFYVGIFCLAAGVFFAAKHILRPRKLADPSYLHFKEE